MNYSMKIKKFLEFKENNILYIFDFDDTLVKTPDFEEVALPYIKENTNIEELIDKCINEIDIEKSYIKFMDRRLYIEDPDNKISIPTNSKYWIRKGLRIYLLPPNEFSLTDESLPKETKELKGLYNSVENKCIVTARPEIIRNKILKTLKELGFSNPKWGLHMYPHLNHRNAGEWKGHKIVEIIKESGFKSAIFYDDNSKYIKKAKRVIEIELPGFDIKYVKV